MDFAVPADQRVKLKESKKRGKYQDLARELESDGYTNCNWCIQYSHQRIGAGTGELGNKWLSGDHPNNSIVEIGHNTEKGPGELRRLVSLRLQWNAIS